MKYKKGDYVYCIGRIQQIDSDGVRVIFPWEREDEFYSIHRSYMNEEAISGKVLHPVHENGYMYKEGDVVSYHGKVYEVRGVGGGCVELGFLCNPPQEDVHLVCRYQDREDH